MLAFVEVLRSDAHKGLKFAFGIAALPLLFFVGGSLFFAAIKIFERSYRAKFGPFGIR